MMGLISNGGWVMAVILGLSITALAIVLQKLLMIKATRSEDNFIQSVKTKLTTESRESVLKGLQYAHTAGQIAAKSIEKHGASDAAISAEIAEVCKQDVKELTSKMSVLSMIITTAPVLGLLGTVLGLMDVFSVIALEGTGQAELLSAGISKALVTTVAGLSLAIPLMFVHQFLNAKINERLDEWDNIPVQLLAVLNDRG